MTITGGISWFGRAYGLGADSIVTVELVDGLGRLRRVSATEDPELFWAVRGGGGDFGIITRHRGRAAPRAGGVRRPAAVADRADGRGARAPSARSPRSAPEELTIWFHTYQFPPLPEVPEPIRGKSLRRRSPSPTSATAEDAEELLAPFRAIPGLAMDLMGEVPLSRAGLDRRRADRPDAGHAALAPARPTSTTTPSTALVAVGRRRTAARRCRSSRSATSAARSPTTARAPASHGPVTEPYNLFALGVPAVPELVEVIEHVLRPASAPPSRTSPAAARCSTSSTSTEDPGRVVVARDPRAARRAKQVSDPLQHHPQQPPRPPLNTPTPITREKETVMNKPDHQPVDLAGPARLLPGRPRRGAAADAVRRRPGLRSTPTATSSHDGDVAGQAAPGDGQRRDRARRRRDDPGRRGPLRHPRHRHRRVLPRVGPARAAARLACPAGGVLVQVDGSPTPRCSSRYRSDRGELSDRPARRLLQPHQQLAVVEEPGLEDLVARLDERAEGRVARATSP